MKNIIIILTVLALAATGCNSLKKRNNTVRGLTDTIGYAHTAQQMDSIMARIQRIQGEAYNDHLKFKDKGPALAVLCPHDDYAYVGELYPATVRNIKANTVIIFGVAHKAKRYGLENKLVFDSYGYWHGPYGKIPVSSLREDILEEMPEDMVIVHDSMQALEHSVEAIVPFLQYFNKKVQIVSILVPYMPYNRMVEISDTLSGVLADVMKQHNLKPGKDVAFIFSSDAVHYGDEDWGGKDFAYYGTSCTSYKDAREHEIEVLHTIAGRITKDKVKKFTQYTVDDYDYHRYKWTWCGRYSVPMGLLTVNLLKEKLEGEPLRGSSIGYTSSLVNMPLPVKDLGMGVTAPAYDHHWVGYAAVRYD